MPHAAITRGYALVLLFIAAAILAAGMLFRKPPKIDQPVRSPSEIQRLEQLTQERRLQDLGNYLSSAADRAAPSLLYLRSEHLTAIAWNGSEAAITAPWSTNPPEQVNATLDDGQSLLLHLRYTALGAPLTLFLSNKAKPAKIKPVPVATASSGDWVIAVARDSADNLIYAHGLFHGTASVRCGGISYERLLSSTLLSRTFLGGGLFTLNGNLLGVVTLCGEELVVLSNNSLARIIAQPLSPNDVLERRYGMRVTEKTLQISAVWEGKSAAVSGIRAGDVLHAVDGAVVQSFDQLTSLANGNAGHHLQLQRERRIISVDLGTVDVNRILTPVQTNGGLTVSQRSSDGNVIVAGVQTGSPAAQAGILPGDVLKQVGSATVRDLSSATTLLQDNRKARKLLLQRNGTPFEVFFQP